MSNRKELFYQSIAQEFYTKKDRLNYFLEKKYDSTFRKLTELKKEVRPYYLDNEIPNELRNKVSELLLHKIVNLGDDSTFLNFRNFTTGEQVYNFLEDLIEKFPKNIQNGPEGNYRESLIRSYLRDILPQPSAVGTGFVADSDNYSSTQIDIIVYDPRIPPLFKSDELVVVVPEAVYGLIEVKTTHRRTNFDKELYKAESNGSLVIDSLEEFLIQKNGENNYTGIIENYFFNGIFYYSLERDIITNNYHLVNSRDDYLWNAKEYSSVNHIALSNSIFARNYNKEFSLYDMNEKKLAFSYFFSNLIQIIMNRNNVSSSTLFNHIFPIDDLEGKETLKIFR